MHEEVVSLLDSLQRSPDCCASPAEGRYLSKCVFLSTNLHDHDMRTKHVLLSPISLEVSQLEKTLFVFIAVFFAASASAEIAQWVDDNGRVNYGDRVPERYKNRSKLVNGSNGDPTEAQIEEARSRSQKNKEYLRRQAVVLPPAEKQHANTIQASPSSQEKELSCEEQWKRYDEAWACLNPYRIGGGIIKGGEGLDKCPLVKQPEICKN